MVSLLSKSLQWLNKKIKSTDRYARPIAFTYQGEERFATSIGGLCSITALVILLVYACLLIRMTVMRSNTSKSSSTFIHDVYGINNKIYLNKTDFKWAVKVEGIEMQDLFDPTKFEVVGTSYSSKINSNGDWEEIIQDFSLVDWDTDNFAYGERVAGGYGLTGYLCPDTNDFELGGNAFRGLDSYFEISVYVCRNNVTYWADEDELRDIVKGSYLDLIYINRYFDFENYEFPERNYIDGDFTPLTWDVVKYNDVYVRYNYAEHFDSFLFVGSYYYSKFFSVERIESDFMFAKDFSDEEIPLITVSFYKDPKQNSYERSVSNVLDLLGDIGGMDAILQIGAGLFVAIFADKIYFYSIIASLYQVDPLNKKNEKEKLSTEKENLNHKGLQKIEEEKIPDTLFQQSINPPISSEVLPEFPEMLGFYNKLTQNGVDKETSSERARIFGRTSQSMTARRTYNCTWRDFVYNLCWSRWKSQAWFKNPRQSLYGRLKLFEKGSKKFIKEFDAVEYAKSLRHLKMLVSSLMDDSERTLSAYQHLNTIGIDSSNSESEDEYAIVPKMIDKNSKVKDKHEEKLKQFLQTYSEEVWTAKDYKLMNGVFSSHKLNNAKLKKLKVNSEKDDEDQEETSKRLIHQGNNTLLANEWEWRRKTKVKKDSKHEQLSSSINSFSQISEPSKSKDEDSLEKIDENSQDSYEDG